MSKMFFTFKWGKGTYVTNEELKKLLLKYYTKEEVDEILKQYATNEAVAGELALKLDISEFEEFKSNLQTELDEKADQVWVEQEVDRLDEGVSNLDGRVTANTENIVANTSKITSNKQLLDELTEQLRAGKILVIDGVYDINTTYNQFRLVFSEESANANIYMSLQDNNVGHALTDTNWWKNLGGVAGSISLDNYYTKSESDAKYAKLIDTNTFKAEQTFKADGNPTSFRINSFEWNGTKYSGLYANDSSGIRLKFEIGEGGVPEIKTQGKNDLVVKNLAEPNENSQAATKGYVDNKVANIPPTDLSNVAKLNKNNTYNSGVRNIFRTLPEVYTEKTTPTKNTEFTTKKYVDDAIANIPSGGSSVQCVVKHDGGTIHMPNDRTKVEIVFTSEENPEVIQAYKDNRFIYSLRSGGNKEGETNEFIIIQGVETLYESSSSYSDLTISAYVENLNEEPAFALVLCNFVYW